MKKVIMLMLVLATVSVTAQDRGLRKHKKERMEHLEEFSPEEIAQLKTKKLTLALDLNAAQQERINALALKSAQERKLKIEERKQKTSDKKLTKEERFAKMNERLDKQIAYKAEIKTILNQEQFEKWEKLEASKHANFRHRKGHAKRHKR